MGVCASRQSPPHAEAGGQRSAQDWLAEALSIDPPDPSPESGDALGVGGLTGELSAGWGGCQPGAPCPPPCAHTAPCLGHLLPQEAQRVHGAGSLHLYLSGPPVCRRLGLNQVCAGGRGSLALSMYRPMIPGVQGGAHPGVSGLLASVLRGAPQLCMLDSHLTSLSLLSRVLGPKYSHLPPPPRNVATAWCQLGPHSLLN